MRKYKIGITFNLEAKVTDIWANGANQNVIHLFHLFQHSSIVEDVILVSWGPEKRRGIYACWIKFEIRVN